MTVLNLHTLLRELCQWGKQDLTFIVSYTERFLKDVTSPLHLPCKGQNITNHISRYGSRGCIFIYWRSNSPSEEASEPKSHEARVNHAKSVQEGPERVHKNTGKKTRKCQEQPPRKAGRSQINKVKAMWQVQREACRTSTTDFFKLFLILFMCIKWIHSTYSTVQI